MTWSSGEDVLQQSNFNTYNNYSNLNQIITFSGSPRWRLLHSDVGSGSFTLATSEPDIVLPTLLTGNTVTIVAPPGINVVLYPGELVTGPDVPAGTTISQISPDQQEIILSQYTGGNSTFEDLTFVQPEAPCCPVRAPPGPCNPAARAA